MCNSRLLLNDVPVFHENLFKIRCGRVISGIKRQIFFAFSVLLVEFVLKRRSASPLIKPFFRIERVAR